MRQSKNILILSGLFAVLSFLALNPLLGQQKIQIKEGTANVGHFSVEILLNKPGAPMTSFSGSGGTVVVDDDDNNFILRLRNLVWFDMENQMDLGIDVNMISPRTSCDISFDNVGRTIYLKPIPTLVTDIPFRVKGTGSVKILVPFIYLAGEGRFLQEFTITLEEEEKQSSSSSFAGRNSDSKSDSNSELSSNEAGQIWDKVDKRSFNDVANFAIKYKNERRAKRYVEKALKLAGELKVAESQNNESKRSVSEVLSSKQTVPPNSDMSSAFQDPKEASKPKGKGDDIDNSEMVEDLGEAVDNLFGGNDDENNQEVYKLSMVFEGGENKILDVHIDEMPLQVNLMRLGETQHDLINSIPIDRFNRDSIISVDASLLKSLKLVGDFSKYTVTNAFGAEIDEGMLSINTDKSGSSNMLWIILGISALVFGLGGFMFLSRSRNEKKRQENKKIIAAKMKENRVAEQQNSESSLTNQNVGANISAPASAVESGQKKQKIKIGGKKIKNEVPEITPPKGAIERSSGSKSRFIIRSKKKGGLPIEFAAFTALVEGKKAVQLDLGDIWSDSRIGRMYLTPQFIDELDTFLAESSNDGIQNELQGAVPEVGGFLMGRYSEKGGSLQVLVEKFVAFVPEYNDVFKIEIGTKTVVDELGDAQDKNPEQEVIGWFHTHPGHGLFLSTSDLSVHRHFPNDYQVAMEIDSLTQGLDMSFFTRKSSGKMNNSNDRNEGAGWFQWVDVENKNVS